MGASMHTWFFGILWLADRCRWSRNIARICRNERPAATHSGVWQCTMDMLEAATSHTVSVRVKELKIVARYAIDGNWKCSVNIAWSVAWLTITHNSFDSGLISGINGIYLFVCSQNRASHGFISIYLANATSHTNTRHIDYSLNIVYCLCPYYLARMRANKVGKPNGIAWYCWYCRPSCKHWKTTYCEWATVQYVTWAKNIYYIRAVYMHFLLFPLNPFPAFALMGESHAILIILRQPSALEILQFHFARLHT